MRITVGLKQLDKELPVPQNAYEGDAAVDLRSTEDVSLAPGQRALVSTGIAIELPINCAALVVPRSGLAIKHGISVVNAPGLIDSNYRGEIKVILLNTDLKEPFEVKRGDRIAQLMIVSVEQPQFEIKGELSDTSRGSGGFGSSGISQ